jgi:hypothetical protein
MISKNRSFSSSGDIFTSTTRAVNGIFLSVYPTRIIPDKTDMDKVLFSLGHQIWVWIRKKIVNLSSMDMDKRFLLTIIHWINYINIEI